MGTKASKAILFLAVVAGMMVLGKSWYAKLTPRRSAEIQMFMGNYDRAIPKLLTAYDDNPADQSIILELAECYDRTGDKATASRLYQSVGEFLSEAKLQGKYGYHEARARTLRELGH
jgi:tetratricopeptide (TPR) repeat protein